MTFTQLQALFSSIFGRTGQVSTANIQLFINEGYKRFATLTGCVRGVATLSSVANQPEYSLQSWIDKVSEVYYRGKICTIITEEDLYTEMFNRNYTEGVVGDLSITRAVIKDYDNQAAGASGTLKRLLLYPIPTDGAAATALNLVTGLGTSATTIPVDDASEFAVPYGNFTMGTEIVHYNYKDGTNFYACLRSQEGTTAASPQTADDTVITENDIILKCIKIPSSMATGTDLPTGIDEAYHSTLVDYAISRAFETISKLDESGEYLKKFDRKVVEYLTNLEMSKGEATRQYEWTIYN